MQTVWAFGVTAWELLACGETPYSQFSSDDDVAAWVRGGGQLPRPAACVDASYDGLWSLLQSCWQKNPKNRPTFAQLGAALGQLRHGVVLQPPNLRVRGAEGKHAVAFGQPTSQ